MSEVRAWTGCGHKIKHPTKADARRALNGMIRSGRVHVRMNVYRCPECNNWHVGRKPRGRNRAENRRRRRDRHRRYRR